MFATGAVSEFSLCAHVRRLSSAGTVLYIRLDNSALSRIGLRHGDIIEIELGRVCVAGIVKTSGGSPWLAPCSGSSNAAITTILRSAGFEHGADVRSTGRLLEDGSNGFRVAPVSTTQAQAERLSFESCNASAKTTNSKQTRELWLTNDAGGWHAALGRYWQFLKPDNIALEREMERLDLANIKRMDAVGWYHFLLEKYFRWKYTAPNRYATTTKRLRWYEANQKLETLHAIKERLFAFDKDNIRHGLAIASGIRGLGTAGASGLLAILFPTNFGTVDQFVVKALSTIPELPEIGRIRTMAVNPESLNIEDGVVLIRIMRRKAQELNKAFATSEWTPRKIDMVLWTCAR